MAFLPLVLQSVSSTCVSPGPEYEEINGRFYRGIADRVATRQVAAETCALDGTRLAIAQELPDFEALNNTYSEA